MKKVWCTVFLGIFLIFSYGSCARMDNSLMDGYYTAEAAVFDDYGWKEYVTVRISGGRIIHVEFNAFNSSGFLKSWDMNYMRLMNAESGTYPSAYSRIYGGKFLEKQGTEGLECISGATYSYNTFLRLAEAVLENARTGDTEPRRVNLPVEIRDIH